MTDVDARAREYVAVVRDGVIAEGAGLTVEAAGQWIALFRVDGTYYAIDNACPHMAGPLGAGELDRYAVTCPLHHWQIDIRTGTSTTNEHVRVRRFDTLVENGWVLVAL
jgi:nitrite reductase (NADH) small subunit/3-phenylpropionate/trans-cinnamate dioxygenase ferredoxin subunit